ncbi:MAG: FeoC-like transcriptional regulator [Nitrososphaeria archaeon]
MDNKLVISSDSIEEIGFRVLEFIKSLGYIDRKSLMEKFNLDEETLQRVFDILEEKGLLKPVTGECDLTSCKGCPYIGLCSKGKTKFYILG